MINQLRKKLKKKKKVVPKDSFEVEPIKIKSTSRSVIELKNIFENCENDIFGTKEPLKEDDLYNRFLSFLDANRTGKKLPTAAYTEQQLQIGQKKRKELSKKAYEAGILRKPTKNSYEFIEKVI